MSTLTTTRLATLPRVNLLPPEIEEQRRFRRLQAGLGVGVLGVVGVVAALTVLAGNAVSDAEAELSTAQARGTELQAEKTQYAMVPLVYQEVEAASAQLTLAMGKEVRWSYFLNDISLRVPDGVWLTSMSAEQAVDATSTPVVGAPATAVAPGAVGASGGALGTVTFVGTGMKHNDVAAWLDSLAKQQGLASPYFTNSTKAAIDGQSVVNFTSMAVLTEEALSNRYTTKAGS